MFSKEMAVNFARETVRMVLTIYGYLVDIARLLVLPVVTFSLLSAVSLVVVRAISDYSIRRSSSSEFVIWGETLTLMILVVVLCAASFGFASAYGPRFVFAGTEAALTIGIIGYAVLSLVAMALPVLWWSFSRIDLDVSALKPGRLYVLNSVALTGSILTLTAIVVIEELFLGRPKSGPTRFGFRQGDAALIIAVTIVGAFAVVALWFGLGPITEALRRTAGQ